MNLQSTMTAVEYHADRTLEAYDEEALIADERENEARNAVTFQDFIEQLAVTADSTQKAFMNVFTKTHRLHELLRDAVLEGAFERAVQQKLQGK